MEKSVQQDVPLPPTIPSSVVVRSQSPPASIHHSIVSDYSTSDHSRYYTPSKKEIERLGRVRPECFKSAWSEIGFVLSICMSQILTVRFLLPIFYDFYVFFFFFFLRWGAQHTCTHAIVIMICPGYIRKYPINRRTEEEDISRAQPTY